MLFDKHDVSSSQSLLNPINCGTIHHNGLNGVVRSIVLFANYKLCFGNSGCNTPCDNVQGVTFTKRKLLIGNEIQIHCQSSSLLSGNTNCAISANSTP